MSRTANAAVAARQVTDGVCDTIGGDKQKVARVVHDVGLNMHSAFANLTVAETFAAYVGVTLMTQHAIKNELGAGAEQLEEIIKRFWVEFEAEERRRA